LIKEQKAEEIQIQKAMLELQKQHQKKIEGYSVRIADLTTKLKDTEDEKSELQKRISVQKIHMVDMTTQHKHELYR
jgi:hypothetical protein